MMEMMDRAIGSTWIRGIFGLPVGVHFLGQNRDTPKTVFVSTVCLEGVSKIAPESGFETMVFLDGCTFFSLYTEKYKTAALAKSGHRRIVKNILGRNLRLSVDLAHYCAFEEVGEREGLKLSNRG